MFSYAKYDTVDLRYDKYDISAQTSTSFRVDEVPNETGVVKASKVSGATTGALYKETEHC